MIDAIKRIRRIVDKYHPPGHLPYRLEDIRAAVVEVTAIDCVRFFAYPDDGGNPVKGRFRRYDGTMGPYAGDGCIVEIDYNQALEPWWIRYVIAKELCHALELDPTVRVSGFSELETLISAMRQTRGAAAEVSAVYQPFMSEVTAEACALELLCPARDRRRIVDNRAEMKLSDMGLAKAFGIPLTHVQILFDPEYVTFWERLFDASGAAN